MNFHRFFGRLLSIMMLISLGSIVLAQDDLSTDDFSVNDVLSLMAQAHTQYNQIHVRYVVDLGGQQTHHEVWLNNTSGQFRHEVMRANDRVQLTVSDGTYAYLEPGPTGVPITLRVLPNNRGEPLANRMLGGIGTLISPLSVVEHRLRQSEIRLEAIESFDTALSTQLITAVRLRVQTAGFYSSELWVDLESGVIVKEVIYGSDGNVFSTTTLEMVEFDNNIDSSFFVIDASQYNPDQLREIFPPSPVNE